MVQKVDISGTKNKHVCDIARIYFAYLGNHSIDSEDVSFR